MSCCRRCAFVSDTPRKIGVRRMLGDVGLYSRFSIRSHPLRDYQRAPVQAVLDSVLNQRGDEFAWVFSRQAGKDEAKAQLTVYLLQLMARRGGAIVEANPTYKPQSLVALGRTKARFASSLLARGLWRSAGYKLYCGLASVTYLSAELSSNVRGETASLLLICNEMQDVSAAKWDSEFIPMAASTNATRLYIGTVKTSATLLAAKMRELRLLEARDGVQRVFLIPWELVEKENAAYGTFVRGLIMKKGRNHPSIKTEFDLIEVDADGGMFGAARQALMRGDHGRLFAPLPNERYVATLDVGGEDDAVRGGADVLDNPRRDYTALSVCRVVSHLGLSRYEVVHQVCWHGVGAASLYGSLCLLLDCWSPVRIVVDATGVGGGLASLLYARYGDRVLPFTFTTRSKAALGSDFLSLIETGRFGFWAGDDEAARVFWQQVAACSYTIPPGEGAIDRTMKWGVPDGTTSDGYDDQGNPARLSVHDDVLISAALVAALGDARFYDGGGAVVTAETSISQRIDGDGF